MVDELKLLSNDLRSLSISEQEVVLPFDASIKAIEHWRAQGIAMLGWEGWIQYPDGRTGHSVNFQGTISIERRADESWAAYVQRSADFCITTIKEAHEEWSRQPEVVGATLYYCLTATSA